MKKIFLVVLLLGSIGLTAQQSANQLLQAVTQKFKKVKDYSADVRIISDIPFLKVMPVSATIYFKQKDKFTVVSQGISFLPKQGFTEIYKMVSDSTKYTAMRTNREKVDQIVTEVISVIPTDDSGDLVLAKLWIDPVRNIIMKSMITDRATGTVQINYVYKSQVAMGLPDEMKFTVDVKKFKIPKGLAADLNKKTTAAPKDNQKGTIQLLLSNYKINKGVDDAVFKK